MSYCILIPTINRKDLLIEALDWYIPNLKRTEIIVLDNGKQGIASGAPNLKVFESEENKGVAGSWNWLINKAIERGHTLASFEPKKYFLGLKSLTYLMKASA